MIEFMTVAQRSDKLRIPHPVREAVKSRFNRRDIFLGSAAVGAGLVASATPSMAQGRSVKEMLVGAWSLIDIYDETTDGVHHQSWGPGVEGLTLYTAAGQFSAQVMAANRDKTASKDPRQPVGLCVSYFGSYSVDEAAMSVALRVERSSFPAWDGIERVSKIVAITEEELKTVAATAHLPDLGDIHPNQHYKQVG